MQKFCAALFEKKALADATEGVETKIRASYLEIYNENIKDLLNPKLLDCKIYTNKDGSIFVRNL
jgi:hypothetical protein